MLLSTPPKPISQLWRPELTRFPRLHGLRRAFRLCIRMLARILIRALAVAELRGVEHLPGGPVLYVTNHLGDADALLLLIALPSAPEALGKIELLSEYPVLGRIMDWYGIIWLHRGRVDRRALDFGVRALHEGRSLIIAPEGRYSLSGGMERGGRGAAYLALHARARVVPLALTGTRNADVYSDLRRLRRPHITLTAGEPYDLQTLRERPHALDQATQQIMESIARLLPPEYRGAYGASADKRTASPRQ